MINHLAALLLAVAAALPARALEVSLEENRAERGSIGYVDLQAVFHRFPDTQRAKQSYAEVVRQAEEQVNLKKAALMELHSELADLKAERDEAAKTPLFTAPPPQVSTAPATVLPSTTSVLAVTPSTTPAAVPLSTAAARPPPLSTAPALGALPGMSAPASTEPLKISIPGLPQESLTPAAPAVAASTPAAVAASTGVVASPSAPPGPSAAELQAMAEASLHRRDARIKELDAAIAAKEDEIAGKEKTLGTFEVDVEKNLVDIESKRSEMLLGRIYLAVREAAIENGVSVVIDKSAILYGQAAVDLTDKVLKKLEGSTP